MFFIKNANKLEQKCVIVCIGSSFLGFIREESGGEIRKGIDFECGLCLSL